MEELKRQAEKVDPSIIGWDHEGNPNFIYAQYDGPLGTIKGIDLIEKEIVEL
jgi:hypothetical protein